MTRYGQRHDVSSESSEDFLDAVPEPEPCTLDRAENAEMAEERLANMERQLAAAMDEIARLRAAPAAMAVDAADEGAGNNASDFRLPREFVDFLLSDGSNTALWRIRLTAVCQRLNCMQYLELPSMGIDRNVDGAVVATNWRVRAVRALLISSIKTEALIHLASTLRARNPLIDAMLTDVHPHEIYKYIIDAWRERSVGTKYDLVTQLQSFELFQGEPVGVMCDRLMTLWGDLTVAECEPKEMQIVDAAIRATRKHADFAIMAAVLETTPNLTFNTVKIKLIAWEGRLKTHAMDAPVRANPTLGVTSTTPSSLALSLPSSSSSPPPDPMTAMMNAMAALMDAKLNAFTQRGGGANGRGRGRGRGSGRGAMQGVQCYNCNGYGHMQNACPHPRK
jgi:hypothetical protein